MTPVLRESFTPKQVEVIEYDLENKPRHTILHGAIRSAKTTTNILLFISHVASFRNQKKKFIITGSSISAIKRNVLDDMSRLLPIDTHLSQKNEFTLLGNTIICFGADQSDSYKYMKGFTAYGWLGNEVTDHHPNSIDQALKRCSGKGARIFWDTNPSDPDHFIKTNFIDRSDSLLENGKIDIKSWHFTLDDNTKLDPEYIESIKRSTPEGVLYDRDILGIWVAGSGQIGAFQSVTEWKCQYSVGFVDPSFSDRVGSDSTAVAVVGVQDDLLVFTGMLFPKSIADPETRKELLDFLNVYTPIETVFESQLSDSSIFFLDVMKRDELIYDIKNLWTVKHQSRGKHERIMATVAVQKQNMRILEGTQQAFSLEVSRYRKDAPHDDACLVGETKIITITGNKKIKDIKKGDRVLTPFGFKKVLKSGFTGEKEIIEVVGLRITHNHKVYNKLLNHFTVANSLTGKNECDILSIKGIIKWKILLYLTGKNIQNRETIISLAKQHQGGKRRSLIGDISTK